MQKISQHSVRRRVEFAETDMAGIAHFSNFFRWMELAEASLYRALDMPLLAESDGYLTGWPRVRANCAYHAPVTFGDELEIQLTIKEVKIRAIEYRFRFEKIADAGPLHIASGELTTIFARRPCAGGAMESATIPQELLERIEAAG